MGSINPSEKPHAVCVPFPAQGHVNPLLKLAKLLHRHGFHITFVLTEFNYRRLVRSQGPDAVKGLTDFQFAAIPDGLPYSDEDATQNIPDVAVSTMKTCLAPFLGLLRKLNDGAASGSGAPPVSCIVSDAVMTFTLDAAREIGVPDILFWTTSACGFLAYLSYQLLVDRGLLPLKDEADFTNGFLDTEVGPVAGLADNLRLRDFPSFMLTTDRNEKMLDYVLHETSRATIGSVLLLNTFEDLEIPAIAELRKKLPSVHTIGPLSSMIRQAIPNDSPVAAINTSLWAEDRTCLDWLQNRNPNSVVYVNFGSITVMTNDQLVEFAWGLANSGYDFLWVIRPDLVRGDSQVLPPEFLEETKGRGLMASWCPQEELLFHPAVAVFLTHCGWNSVAESISGGVPMICWPFFAEQQTNCRYSCADWGVGMEIDPNVKREEVEGLIREMIAGEKGSEMRRKATEWKEIATTGVMPHGSSAASLEKVIQQVLRSNRN